MMAVSMIIMKIIMIMEIIIIMEILMMKIVHVKRKHPNHYHYLCHGALKELTRRRSFFLRPYMS